MKLRTGEYKVTPNSCDAFFLFSSDGQIYHFRHMKQGVNCIKINVLHTDDYQGNVPFQAERLGDIKPLFDKIDIEDPERSRLRPIKIVYNKHLSTTPARIFSTLNPAIIEVAPKLYNMPKQMRMFILLHEYGHLFYATEWKVDLFALKAFCELGYNPSQAFYALSKILSTSKQNMERIKKLFDTLKANGYIDNN